MWGVGWLRAITAAAAVPLAATSGHQLPHTVSVAPTLFVQIQIQIHGNEEIQKKWPLEHTVESCLLWADEKWFQHPMVTNSAISIADVRIKQVATEHFQRKETQSTSGYKIMEIVGRFTAENHWDASFALTCYRAARNLDDDLTPEETDILDELYSGITFLAL